MSSTLTVGITTRHRPEAAIAAALDVMRADPRVGAVAFAQAEADGRPWPRTRWKTADPGGGLWLFRELVRQFPAAWRARRPVSRATLKRWRALASRVVPNAVPAAGRGVDGR